MPNMEHPRHTAAEVVLWKVIEVATVAGITVIRSTLNMVMEEEAVMLATAEVWPMGQELLPGGRQSLAQRQQGGSSVVFQEPVIHLPQ